jgi:hypothetical protein
MISTDHLVGFLAGISYVAMVAGLVSFLNWLARKCEARDAVKDRGYTEHWRLEE